MADRVIFVCILVLAGAYFYATEKLPSLEIGDPLGPKAFPRLLGVGLVLTAAVFLFEILRVPRTARVAKARDPQERGALLVVAAVAVWTFAYFFVFEGLGFVIATMIYLIGLMSYFNRGKWVANISTTILFSFGSYLMFTKLLGVNLARGVLPF